MLASGTLAARTAGRNGATAWRGVNAARRPAAVMTSSQPPMAIRPLVLSPPGPPLNQAAAHSASSSEMPVSEFGAIARPAAQPASPRSALRPLAAAAPHRAASRRAALPLSACCALPGPATSFPFAGRFSPETIWSSLARGCDQLQLIDYLAY